MTIFYAMQENDMAAFMARVEKQHSTTTERNRRPLHVVPTAEFASLLVVHGADVHVEDDRGNTPLHYAQHPDIADVLIRAGACVNAKNKAGSTPLVVCSNACVKKRLLECKAEVNVCDYNRDTPLHLIYGDVELCRELIRLGADVNAVNCIGVTPLHVCFSLPCAKLLVEAGANVNVIAIHSWTPLFKKNKDVTQYLIEQGADMNTGKFSRCTALDCARIFKMRETEVTLVLEGCDVSEYQEYIFLHFITLICQK